ncbi:MAG: hydantoinase/oxoprolinase family protein [Solirubrobacterales bacterium]
MSEPNGLTTGGTEAFVGVDVGGTHTDVQVIAGSREARGKALTTYDDFSRGVLGAVEVAAANLDMSVRDLLGSTQLLVNATTVVTNAIAQFKGAKVGVLVTKGFRDEFRFGGGPRERTVDDQLQTNVPDLIDRGDVLEVGERVDFAGEELVALAEDEVLEAARALVERGVSAIAVCFLHSYGNPRHEERAAELVEREFPEIFVTPSHRVSSVRGEYQRWITAVLNCYVHEDAKRFLNALGTKLKEAGLKGGVSFFQGLGGGISQEGAEALPLKLLGAGPAGGATGANELAKRLGHDRVLLGDMGGTSFDTGLIHDNVVHIEKDVKVGRYATSLPLVDVISVGAGGGSIAWISERGAPQVGPQSAGSTPGPAAYNNGGKLPTVTDAMVAMDLIDPENYLGGRVELRRDLAIEAIRAEFAEPMGWSVEEAANAIHDLVVTNMANAVREVSVAHGYDPRDFVFYAYGGTMPWFAAQIAETLGIGTVLIPHSSSVFCARGLLTSDFVIRSDQTIQASLATAAEVDRINEVARTLVDGGTTTMGEEGFGPDEIETRRAGDFQFAGQVHALSMPLPDRELTADDVPELQRRFHEIYERTYGRGTAWPGVPPQLLNLSVTVTGRLPRPSIEERESQPSTVEEMMKGEREVHLPTEGRREVVPVFAESKITPGSSLAGPALVEAVDTTLLVPRGVTVSRDGLMNLVLTKEEDA